LPLTPPFTNIAGSPANIETGNVFGSEVNDDPINKDKYHPARCYEKMSLLACPENVECPDVANLAYILNHTYTSPHLSLARFTLAYGIPDRQKWTNGTDSPLRSVSYHFRKGTTAYIFVDGTRNYSQFFLQAYYYNKYPRSYGEWGANPMFAENADEMLARMSETDWSLCDDWVIVGHSYGGATACVLAACLRRVHPTDRIRLVTFGAPSPGDIRLRDYLNSVCQRHLYHPLDPIAFTPPRQAWVDIAFVPPFLDFLIGWESWARVRPRYQLTEGGIGNATENAIEPGESVLTNLGLNIINNSPLASYTYHAMQTYSDNAEAACEPAPPPL